MDHLVCVVEIMCSISGDYDGLVNFKINASFHGDQILLFGAEVPCHDHFINNYIFKLPYN